MILLDYRSARLGELVHPIKLHGRSPLEEDTINQMRALRKWAFLPDLGASLSNESPPYGRSLGTKLA